MSFFRSSKSSTSKWCKHSDSPRPACGQQRMCRFGSTCLKFGCPFKHPQSRPRDCPDGERCNEARCPLHHPKSRAIRQHDHPESTPCQLLFSGMNMPPSPPGKPLSRYSNRMIVRTPMTIPSPNTRPTSGYFAATTKPCTHGAMCVKYGCTYKHPPARTADCARVVDCEDNDCALLHPIDVTGTGAVDLGFAVGQKVQARFLPNSTRWSDATVRCIRGSVFTLQFSGFDDVSQVPLRRVRHPKTNGAHSPVSPPSPPPTSTRPGSPPPLLQLERLKQEAVAREDFLVAAQIKRRMQDLAQIAQLQKQKQKAVDEENFLLAMELKLKIADIEKRPEQQPSDQPSAIAAK